MPWLNVGVRGRLATSRLSILFVMMFGGLASLGLLLPAAAAALRADPLGTPIDPPGSLGRIEIVQLTVPEGAIGVFDFTSTAVATPTFSLSHGMIETLDVAAGIFTVTQSAAAGFTLADIICDGDATTDIDNRRAVITATNGATISCTFTNTPDPLPPGTIFDAGNYHNCAIRPDKSIACWGWNNQNMAPESVAGSFHSVSAGGGHTCALKTDRTIACWGSSNGGLVPNTLTDPFIDVATGYTHSCGLKADGSVACWGYNGAGQAPSSVAGPFTAITAGYHHTCGLRPNGSAKCWGYNSDGQVPAGDVSGPFKTISAGDYHNCGLKTDNSISCWGKTFANQPASLVGPFSQVVAGGDNTCALKTDGSALCWGYNVINQAPPSETGPFTRLAAGLYHTCGMRPDGSVTCWGENYYGQSNGQTGPFGPGGWIKIAQLTEPSTLTETFSYGADSTAIPSFSLSHGMTETLWVAAGTYTLNQSAAAGFYLSDLSCTGGTVTTNVNSRQAVITIAENDSVTCTYTNAELPPVPDEYFSSGGYHNCAIRIDGTLQCWGSNYVNELNAPGGTYTQISAGGGHSCALSTGGSVVCWQFNFFGQSSAPGGTFTQVSAGSNHSCAVRTNGSVACWGNSAHGQLNVPAGTYRQVSGGGLHSCAIRTDGTSVCWGENSSGQSNAPAGTFRQVSAGRNHTCGVRTDGSLACWGHNGYGQINAPGGTYTQVSSDDDHSCALTTSGSIICWGRTDFGMLNAPSGSFTAVTTGLIYSCGLRADGAAICWGGGSNDSGWADSKTGPFGPAGGIKIVQLTSPSTLTNTFSYTSTAAAAPTFSLTHGLTQTIQVPVGTYTVAQGAAANFSLTDLDCTSGGTGNIADRRAVITVTKDATVTCTFTSTRDTGKVVIKKATSPAGLTDTFSFTSTATLTPTFSLSGGEAITLTVPTGALIVTENAAAGFYLSDLSCVGGGAETNPSNRRVALTIAKDATATCTFTNAELPASPPPVLSVGRNHNCAVRPDTSLECWGDGANGKTTLPPLRMKRVSAGDEHTCAIRWDGAAVCWGLNTSGQTTAPAGTFSAIGTGAEHSCGLKTDGTIVCWGASSVNRLNAPAGTFVELSVGLYHSCARAADGSVACWGATAEGQLNVPAGVRFRQISSGYMHSCGVTTSGDVECWGVPVGPAFGQEADRAGAYLQVSASYYTTCALGVGGKVECWGNITNGQAPAPDEVFSQIGVGLSHVCGLRPDGSVNCWGSEALGQSADKTGPFAFGGIIDIAARTDPADLSAEFDFTTTYGDMPSFSLTTGITMPLYAAVGTYTVTQSAEDGFTLTAIDCDDGKPRDAADGQAAITVTADAHVACTFTNTRDTGKVVIKKATSPAGLTDTFSFTSTATLTPTFSLSDGGALTLTVPTGSLTVTESAAAGFTLSDISCDAGGTGDTDTGQAVIDVAKDEVTTCIFTNTRDTGTVVIKKVTDPAGPANTFSFTSTSIFSPTFSLSGGEAITLTVPTGALIVTESAAAGFSPSDISCDAGGTGSIANRQAVITVNKDATVTCTFTNTKWAPPPSEILSAGNPHTCAVRPDGSVDCWGSNDYGQAEDQSGPYTQVSAGSGGSGAHTCALRPNGSADCWGYNESGQAEDQSGPYIQVSTGSYHSCALRPDGSVDCWGANPDGRATDQSGPYTQVSAGYYHTCALRTDGSADCWGNNQFGQATDQSGPYTQVSTGYGHNCGLRPDGSVDCWGWNYYGQATDQIGPYTQVSAGSFHTCALRPNGSVDCWGSNDYGQATNQSGPYTQVSAGSGGSGAHTCGLRPDGSVDCWGLNDYGRATDQRGPYGPAGRIEIAQITEPSTLTNNFSFTSTSTVTPTFSLSHGMTETLWVAVGTYTVTQNAAAGFTLTDLDCASGGTGSIANRRAVVNVTKDAVITCTFTSTRDTGAVVIKKTTSPAGLTDTFSFTSTATLTPTFSLSDGQSITLTVPTGSLTVTESAAAGFTLSDISCVGGVVQADTDTGQAVISVTKDATITCTFTNTRDTGTLQVTKVVSPTGLLDSFTFTLTNSAAETQVFSLIGGVTETFSLPTGNYTVTEAVKEGFELIGRTCTGDARGGRNGVSYTANVTIYKDQTATCTFINEVIPDDDDVDPSTEAGAPNGGDGNGDGTPDYLQSYVTSLPNGQDAAYVTIAAPSGSKMAAVSASPAPPAAALPPGVQLPIGVISFSLTGLTPGATVTVTLHLEATVTANAYYKLQGGVWTEYPQAQFVDSRTIVLTLTDGGAGDLDGVVNGRIDDPGGPGAKPVGSDVFVSTWTAGKVGTLNYGPHDILRWDGESWTKWFDGTAAGLNPTTRWKHNINAFYIPNPAGSEVYMSLTQSQQQVGALGWVDGYDILRWNGTAFSRWFEGERVGLNVKTQEKIDGLHVLPSAPGWSSFSGQTCAAYLLLSTQGPGMVPKPGMKNNVLKFGGEDVLGFCATSLGGGAPGPTTAGRWEMVFDGSAEGLSKNNLDSIAVSDDQRLLYLTTQREIDVDGAFGGHSTVYVYDMLTRQFGGSVFRAAAQGINQKVDGLHLASK